MLIALLIPNLDPEIAHYVSFFIAFFSENMFFPRSYFFLVFFQYLWTVVWKYYVSVVNKSLSSC
jgi:hypothetical protein